jgi:flagellar motor switch protein FliN/FliY
MGSINIANILKIEVPLAVLLAQKLMSVEDILALAPGSVVQFSKSHEAPLHLLANGKVIGAGVAVKVGEKFGLQVRDVGARPDMIAALSGS